MDEYVLAALLRYKTISLCIVEPLYLSLSHTSNLSLGGLQAPVLPPSWRGYPPELEGKQKRRANWARAACVSISHNRYLTPFVPEPARRMTWSSEQVNRFILPERARVLGPHHQHRVGIQGRGPGRQSAARVKRWPGARLLVLTDAKRVASGMAERGHRDLTWPSAPDVDHQQPQRTADVAFAR